MNKIEFSHNYTKLPAGIKTARLVAVEPVRLEEQTVAFFCYDTQIEFEGNHHYVGLDNSDYLCLILKSDSGAIFTTLRKDNSENRKKYMGNYIGGGQFEKQRPEFQIIIKEG